MDFLDPKKERRDRIALFVSYGLVTIAIGIALYVMTYHFNGYNLNSDGDITRNGFVFVSSQPEGSTIYLNGIKNKARTNTRLDLSEGQYNIRLSAKGYRDWQRTVTVAGGDVQRFDYPVLFPTKLQTTTVETIGPATLATQSPDRRWLLLADTRNYGRFRLLDTKDAKNPVATDLTLPDSVFTTGTSTSGSQTWKTVEWSDDNRHVMLLHGYTDTAGAAHGEYILFDRSDPTKSRNLTKELSLAATEKLSLFDKKADKYFAYNPETKVLHAVALPDSSVTKVELAGVLGYKTYSDDTILYVTDSPATAKQADGRVSVILQQGNRSLVLRELPAGADTYLLDLAQYDGRWFVAVGASNGKGMYIYIDPFKQQLASSADTPEPQWFLKVPNPTYLAFSANTQFILAQNSQRIAVYNAENDNAYAYALPRSLDDPQQHVAWMDGDRIMYVSGGKLVVFDYDAQNLQQLQITLSAYGAFFSTNYRGMFSLAQSEADKTTLTYTSLLVEQ